jgi:hypothetical protein
MDFLTYFYVAESLHKNGTQICVISVENRGYESKVWNTKIM